MSSADTDTDLSKKSKVPDGDSVSGVLDYSLPECDPPPPGYPQKSFGDEYSRKPFKGKYSERRQDFLDHVLNNPAPEGIKGYYYELVRIYLNKGPVYRDLIKSTFLFINERNDCSDFVMLGSIRLLYQLANSPLCDEDLQSACRDTLLEFKYWPDEPGIDSMCTWTENHQIMFSSNEYLAGQMFPNSIFTNSGMSGREKMEKARPRIHRWIELRYMTDFNEWLSHVYFDEDITALVNLVDFCKDPSIARKAEIVLDLLFLNIALNSFYGCFSSTHGRSYSREKRCALNEATIDTAKLLFGMGKFSGIDNMSAVSLAMSEKYRLPRIIYDIASDSSRKDTINRQKIGINIDEASKWGLDLNKPDDVMILLSCEAYAHPSTFNGVLKLFDIYRWWDNGFFSIYKKMKFLINFLRYTGLSSLVTRILKKDLCRNTREEVNTYTYKTADYMMSSALDYRKGYGGDQHHIWQATLSYDAVCFTTHPGHKKDTSGGYWVGSGTLPRVAQIKNVLFAVYKISRMPGIIQSNQLFYTHAWFPRNKFDEVIENNGWIFGRKESGYLALYSQHDYRWQDDGEFAENEIIVDGVKNIWICEMGSLSQNGSFPEFISAVAKADLFFSGQRVCYYSPSQGKMEFGWNGPLKQNGQDIELHNHPRYDNPYCQIPFPPKEIHIANKSSELRLNLEEGIREASEFI